MKPFSYTIEELSNALRILKEDLLKASEFNNQIQFNEISDDDKFSRIKIKGDYGLRTDKFNECKIMEWLDTCYSYLKALINEYISFCHTLQYPCNITVDESDTFTSVIFLKVYFQEFYFLSRKTYNEIDSLCTFLMNDCKTFKPCEAKEVLEEFKMSLDDYQTAVAVDLSYQINSEKLISVLQNVKSATRTMQSYIWMVKTLIVLDSPDKKPLD